MKEKLKAVFQRMRIPKISGVLLGIMVALFVVTTIISTSGWILSSAHTQKIAAKAQADLKIVQDDLRVVVGSLNKAEAELQAIKEAQVKAEAEEVKAKAEEKARQELLQLATVGKSKGIEHVLIRQLIADPAETYGFKGDTSDEKAVEFWAQNRAHQLAILAGYVNHKTGEEVRVRGKGGEVAYLLAVDANGNTFVEEYTLGDDGNFKPDPEQTNTLADSYGNAQFQGSSPDGLQSYEYLYTPNRA